VDIEDEPALDLHDGQGTWDELTINNDADANTGKADNNADDDPLLLQVNESSNA